MKLLKFNKIKIHLYLNQRFVTEDLLFAVVEREVHNYIYNKLNTSLYFKLL